jgi:hypothetical protein
VGKRTSRRRIWWRLLAPLLVGAPLVAAVEGATRSLTAAAVVGVFVLLVILLSCYPSPRDT